MNNNTNFSLILPIYNSEKYVAKAIDSVLNQTYNNFELILIDDFSTDSSYNIAKKYANENSKIRLFKMEKNKGAAFCMNYATIRAKYNWLGIVDSDAIMPKNWLEIVNRNISLGVDLIGGRYVLVPNKYQTSYIAKSYLELESKDYIVKTKIYNLKNFSTTPIAGGNFFYTLDLFNELKGFNINLRASYDGLFINNAIEKGYTVKYISELYVYHPLYNYRNFLDIFKRSVIFNLWRISVLKQSKLYNKSYFTINYLVIAILIYTISIYIIFGITFLFLSYICILIIYVLINAIILFFQNKIKRKYILGYILINTIKKIIAITIYLFRIPPTLKDWKER